MRGLRRWWPLVGPSLLVTAVALGAQFLPRSTQLQVRSVLVTTVIVVALYVFVGNSGVMSFGQGPGQRNRRSGCAPVVSSPLHSSSPAFSQLP